MFQAVSDQQVATTGIKEDEGAALLVHGDEDIQAADRQMEPLGDVVEQGSSRFLVDVVMSSVIEHVIFQLKV